MVIFCHFDHQIILSSYRLIFYLGPKFINIDWRIVKMSVTISEISVRKSTSHD